MKIARKLTNFAKKNQRVLWSLLVLLVMVGGIIYWRYGIYDKPGKAWQDMLASSVATKSLTITTEQSVDDNTRKQVVDYKTSDQTIAHSFTDIKQSNESVRLETIGTLDADYVRYTAIDVKDKDYSNAVDQWAKEDHPSQASSNNPQLLPDVVLRLGSGFGIPFGYVPIDKQSNLLKQLSNEVISADMSSVSRQTIDGEDVFVYKATINGQAYASYLKNFADALGFTQLSSYDASSTQEQSVEVEMAVSRKDHRLVRMTYPALSGYTETYGNYNKKFDIPALPENAIGYDELQKLFN